MPDMDDGRLIYGEEGRAGISGETLVMIRRRAYELWEEEGRPAGRELAHWLQAEQEIRPGIENV